MILDKGQVDDIREHHEGIVMPGFANMTEQQEREYDRYVRDRRAILNLCDTIADRDRQIAELEARVRELEAFGDAFKGI